MQLNVVVGGTEKTAARADVYVSGVKRRVNRIEAWNGSAWKVAAQFITPPTLTMVPTSTGKTEDGFGDTISITSNAVLAQVAGGIGPYTYLWVQLTGSAATINSPTSATTTFTDHFVDPGVTETKTYRCTVTDGLAQTANATVTVNFTNRISSGGSD